MTRRLSVIVLALVLAGTGLTANASTAPDVVAAVFVAPDGVAAKLATWEAGIVRSVLVLATSSKTVPAQTVVEVASCTQTVCDVERSIAPASALTIQNGVRAHLRLESVLVGQIDFVFEAEPVGDGGPLGSWGCGVYGGSRTTPHLFARTTGAVSSLTTAGSTIASAKVSGHTGERSAQIGSACGVILHDAVAGYYGGVPTLLGL